MNGDSSSARVEGGPTSLTSFGTIAESPAREKSIGDAMVNKGAEAPKPCPSLVEPRTSTAAVGLIPTDTATTAMKTILSRSISS